MRTVTAIVGFACLAGCQLISGIDDYETGEGAGAAGGGPSTGGSHAGGGGSGGMAAGGSGGVATELTGLWIRPDTAQGNNEIVALATAPGSGDPIVAGHLTSVVTFGNEDIPGPGGYLTRLDQDGQVVWRAEISTTSPEDLAIRAVAASPVVTAVVGHFVDQVAFSTDADTITLNAPGGATFVAAYNTGSGVFLWARRALGTSAEFHDVAVHPSTNEVAAAGTAEGLVVVRGPSDTLALCNGGAVGGDTSDALVVRFSANGDCSDNWVTVLSGCSGLDGDDGATGVAYTDDSLYVAGYFSERLGLDTSECLGAANGADAFVARYTPAGDDPLLYAAEQTTFRGAGNQAVDELVIGASGLVGIIGTFTDELDGEAAVGNRDVFVHVSDAALEAGVTLRTGSNGDALSAGGVHMLPDGIAVSFSCIGPLSIGTQELVGSSEDVCFARLGVNLQASTLSPLFAGRWGDEAPQVPLACGGSSDRFFVAGRNSGVLALPGGVTQDIRGTNLDGFVFAVGASMP